MAVVAPQINQFIDILNNCLSEGKRVGDLNRFAMQRYIREKMPCEPMWALMLRGLLAHVDGRLEDARQDLERAAEINPSSLAISSNLAILLAEAGCDECAAEQARRVLRLSSEQNDWSFLDGMTEVAVGLGALDIVADVIRIANKLDICTPTISQAALLLFVDGESDQETLKNFDSALNEEKLRPLSKKMSDERWAELEKLAEELEPLVN